LKLKYGDLFSNFDFNINLRRYMTADAPAHRLFVLLAPVDEKSNSLPEVLCVVQVALEAGVYTRPLFSSS
jgi:hypothetical protein